jgi:hypothetical protein
MADSDSEKKPMTMPMEPFTRSSSRFLISIALGKENGMREKGDEMDWVKGGKKWRDVSWMSSGRWSKGRRRRGKEEGGTDLSVDLERKLRNGEKIVELLLKLVHRLTRPA